MSLIAFQPGAFQRDTFQTFTRLVKGAFLRPVTSMSVLVKIGDKHVKRGTEIKIPAQAFDNSVRPKLPLDPTAGVKLTLKNPAGTIIVNNQTMTKEATSLYFYLYQSQTTDQVGPWTGTLKVENDGHVFLSEPVQLFVLVA